jgi:type IV secretion system protein TrbI
VSTEAELPMNGRPIQDASASSVETSSPSGMDLRPEPEKAVRISKKAAGCIIGVGATVLAFFAYGGLRRQNQLSAAAQGSVHKKVEPARPDDIQQSLSPAARSTTKPGVALVTPDADPTELQRPDSGLPSERVVVRSVSSPRSVPPAIALAPTSRELAPEERALAAAYAAEQQARLAPTGIRMQPSTLNGLGEHRDGVGIPDAENGSFPQLHALARGLASPNSQSGGPLLRAGASDHSEYDDQSLQAQKETFLEKARLANVREDYLKFTRTPPLSRFEIKAGWEIPAALEQGLNSDLPGELKALVMSNVYDTATGLYLLIPQGTRLVGSYNSRIGYGQNGVQVVWHRAIFPDGSAIDLNAMEGLDSQGNAGLRDKVDHHYKRLFGFAVLTSMFDAALAITQSRQQSVLVYPSTTQEAQGAAGREVSQLGTQITRKNLNVQPTVKIPAGYKFNVRVNRDILFEEPYQPVQPLENDRARLTRNTRQSR